MVRTMSEHIDRVADARPDLISLEQAQTQKATLIELVEKSNVQSTITITEKTISSSGADITLMTRPYTVIAGNSRLVVVEFTDDDGYESVTNIRLVEGGIAIETTNCQEKPEQCQRERRRAMEQLDKRQQSISSVRIASSDEPKIEGLTSSTPADSMSQPKWVYFKKLDDG